MNVEKSILTKMRLRIFYLNTCSVSTNFISRTVAIFLRHKTNSFFYYLCSVRLLFINSFVFLKSTGENQLPRPTENHNIRTKQHVFKHNKWQQKYSKFVCYHTAITSRTACNTGKEGKITKQIFNLDSTTNEFGS